jgi:hypothetical protein
VNGGPGAHFQIMDRPSLLFADGLPYVLDAFVLNRPTPHQAQMLRYFDTLEPVPVATGNARPRGTRFQWAATA